MFLGLCCRCAGALLPGPACLAANHSGRDGFVGLQIHQDETARRRVDAVRVERQQPARRDLDAADLVQRERIGSRSVKRIDVHPVVDALDDGANLLRRME